MNTSDKEKITHNVNHVRSLKEKKKKECVQNFLLFMHKQLANEDSPLMKEMENKTKYGKDQGSISRYKFGNDKVFECIDDIRNYSTINEELLRRYGKQGIHIEVQEKGGAVDSGQIYVDFSYANNKKQ